ncbi:MAG TPA: KpsF/GutQ family sugar-phosphate isomerase [Candidatus Aminicenantes bacterium]|nr:KpsF/GutQ family sugar-phosphate isomerase [Candidatus Aminicenantes bacterium]
MNAIEIGRNVLETEANAIQQAVSRIDHTFEQAVDLLFATRGRLVVTGMGKSGLIGRKIAATMTSTGTPAIFLHPAEAVHGDIGIILPDDTVLALSTSGETEEVVRLISTIKRMGICLISLVGCLESTLARQSDVALDCRVAAEACPIGLVPSASTTLSLAVGDALSIALMTRRGFSAEDFRFYHPAGSIGKKLLKVRHLMHSGDQLPATCESTPMHRVLEVMDEKKFGVAMVVDDQGRLTGIITDGDLRRLLLRGVDFRQATAGDCMKANPQTIGPDRLAVEALRVLEERAITSLAVTDDRKQLLGLLHLHDLWRTEMI